MPPRGLLITSALAACNAGEPAKPPAPPPPPVGGNTMPGQGSAAAIFPEAGVPEAPVDATVFAMFDHIAVRQVKADGARTAPSGVPAPPAHVKLTTKPSSRSAASFTEVHLPPWCQRMIKGLPIVAFHPVDGGGFVVATSGLAALIDADHHADLAIDLSAVTVPTGEEGTIPLAITDAWAAGGALVVAGQDNADDNQRKQVAAIDIVSGGVLWRSALGATQEDIAVVDGLVLTWANGKIRARRLRDGEEIASVAAADGPFNLGRAEDGTVIARSDNGTVLEIAVQ